MITKYSIRASLNLHRLETCLIINTDHLDTLLTSTLSKQKKKTTEKRSKQTIPKTWLTDHLDSDVLLERRRTTQDCLTCTSESEWRQRNKIAGDSLEVILSNAHVSVFSSL